MASAIGSAVSGFMAGQKHSDQRRRDKAIDSLLARDAYEKDLKYESQAIDWENEGNDPAMFPEFDDPTEEDPYLVRGFNWLKNKFGFKAGEQAPDQVVTPPTDEEVEPKSAVPAGRFSGMADGGKVGEERMKRSYGDYYVTEDEAAANREYRESLPPRYQSPHSPYMRDKRGRLESGRTAIPTFTGSGPGIDKDDFVEVGRDIKNAITGSNTYRSLANLGEVAEANVRNIGDANSPEAAGEAVRGSMVDAGAGALNVAGGVASDVVEGLGLDNVPGFVRGFVGRGGTRENRQPDPNTPPPAAAAPVVGESPKTAAIDAAVGDEKPADQVAADAVQKGVEMTPGHPDNPDQAFDWAEVAETGVRPEDIPNMTVKDWVQYRQKAVSAAILRGETPQQAHEAVTKMQMQGAQANLQQAGFLLTAGNPRGAALAARAAFQYFPNGADVQFGIYETPDGPVLVGMGKDEETGEPIKEGAPMMLTNEKLQAMAANFSDPTVFNTWTKDWRDEEFQRRKYHEVEKPQAQSEAIYRDRMGRAALQNADSNALEAQARGRGTGSVKESDFRESFQIQAEGLYMGGIEEEDLIDMNVIANRVRQAVPNQQALSDDQIVKIVLNYYESGDPSELQRYLGGGDAAE